MVVLVLLLIFILRLLQLVHSLLELTEGVLVVLLGLFFLPLKEFKFAFPKSFFLFKLTLEVSILAFHFIVVAFVALNLFANAKFTLRKSLIKLVVLILELLVFNFVSFYQLLLGTLQIFVLFSLHSSVSVVLTLNLLHLFFKLFQGLSLLLVFGFNTFFFLLNSRNSFL